MPPPDETTIKSIRSMADQFVGDDVARCDLRLCFELTCYVWGSIDEQREAIAALYAVARPWIEPHVRWVATDFSMRFRKRTRKTLDILPTWLAEESKPLANLFLHCDETRHSMSERVFWLEMCRDAMGCIRLSIPVEDATRDPDAVFESVMAMTRSLRFRSGHAGFGTNQGYHYWGALQRDNNAYRLSLRFPGIDLGHPLHLNQFFEQHIKGVSWLTLVGEDLLERVGGAESVASKLGEGARVHALEHGCLIRAGAAPQFGDLQQGDDLPDYRRVAAALAPLQFVMNPHRPRSDIGGPENTARWLARFSESTEG